MQTERSDGPTLAQDAYEQLRRAIVRGDIRPNERLVETELAERLKVSRTPIREILQLLVAEGLIVSRRRGWVVREHTPDEIREIYEVRAGLEGMAARLACERADDAQIEAIVAVHRDDDTDLVARSARDHLVEVNDAFHAAIGAAAGNARLATLIGQSRQHFFNHRIAELYSDAEARASVGGHGRLVAALRARDADAAERVMREHVLEALRVTLSKLR